MCHHGVVEEAAMLMKRLVTVLDNTCSDYPDESVDAAACRLPGDVGDQHSAHPSCRAATINTQTTPSTPPECWQAIVDEMKEFLASLENLRHNYEAGCSCPGVCAIVHAPTCCLFEAATSEQDAQETQQHYSTFQISIVASPDARHGKGSIDSCPGSFSFPFDFDVGEIDLSAVPEYSIGDVGCEALCRRMIREITTSRHTQQQRSDDFTTTTDTSWVSCVTTLDLEANGLSPDSGESLARLVANSSCTVTGAYDGICPTLPHSSCAMGSLVTLNLGCNSLGAIGIQALAAALGGSDMNDTPIESKSPLLASLETLDLHGNGMGDDGCVALGMALCGRKNNRKQNNSLHVLDLSANRIEDRGCAALAPLLQRNSTQCCPFLAHLNLRENGIQSIAALLGGAGGADTLLADGKKNAIANRRLLSLELLDLSWNCLSDTPKCDDQNTTSTSNMLSLDEIVMQTFGTGMYPLLEDFFLEGNSLSDRSCQNLRTALVQSGATPCLKIGGYGRKEKCDTVMERTNDDHCGNTEGELRHCLRLLADGHATNASVCQLALWESGTWSDKADNEKQRTEAGGDVGGNDRVSGCFTTTDEEEISSQFHMLRRDGFVVQPPLISVATADIQRLAYKVEQIERNGWPPVFLFMSDSVWEFIGQRVWPVVHDLMGTDCVLDSGSAFAWSLKANGKSTFPRDGEFRTWQNAVSNINATIPKEKEQEGHRGFGSSFGLPHRDYSAADSMHLEEKDNEREFENRDDRTVVDHPAILNVWIPLNDATLENGCMFVVPREFDIDFSRTDNHHAHMNPATEVQRGKSSKIQFPLHGVRALPAPAGSLLAWYGNTIHWGSTCSLHAKDPRKSIALTFRRADIISTNKDADGLEDDDNANKASVHRPSPPMDMTQACTMTLRRDWHLSRGRCFCTISGMRSQMAQCLLSSSKPQEQRFHQEEWHTCLLDGNFNKPGRICWWRTKFATTSPEEASGSKAYFVPSSEALPSLPRGCR